MFFRQKKSGNRVYLQIVENRWEDGRSKQRVIATLGRLDQSCRHRINPGNLHPTRDLVPGSNIFRKTNFAAGLAKLG